MKFATIFSVLFLLSTHASADIFDDHARLAKNANLCEYKLTAKEIVAQKQAAQKFFAMLFTVQKDSEKNKKSAVEVMDSTAYSTTVKNTLSKEECSVILHGDCYSSFCE